jgi:hypothetical protein
LLTSRLTLWLDHNHAFYWAVAGAATLLFLGWVLAAWWTDRSAPDAGSGRWRAPFVLLLLLVAWRWPLWFYPDNYNPDEGLMVAGARTLVADPVFWRSVDGSTAGPLNFYALLVPKLIGAQVNFLTARLTGLLLIWGALVFSYGLLRLFHTRTPARLALLPGALFFAIATQDDFVHYSTEHLSLCLFAGSTFLLVRRQVTAAGGNMAWWIGGLGLGLLPWAKLQSIPLGAAVVAWLGYMLWRDATLPAGEKRRRTRDLLLAGLAPSGLFLALIAAAGVWPFFRQSYILQNFHYVAADTTVTYLWQTLTRSLDLTWHFQASMAGPLLFAVAGSLLYRPLRLRLRAAWWLGFLLFLAALAAVIAPRRPFAHYLLFLVPPLLYWLGAVIGDLWNRPAPPAFRRGLLAAGLLLGGAVPLAVRLSQPAPEMIDRLAEFLAQPHTAAGNILRAYARPGDRLGVWGWMCEFYVEADLPQATRNATSALGIEPSPQSDYYRRLYLTDLLHNRPALFLDAVGPTADFFEDRARAGHEIFPELAVYLRENYTELIDLEYARLYVRTDRFEAAAIDAARLRALAAAGRRVRGRLAPEPVSIAQAHLQQNVIGGRVVRMMLPRSEIAWPLRGTEREFHYEAGYDPRAYLEGDGNGTLFTAELAMPSGAVIPIYTRLLDPVHRTADRGLVRDHFPLPPVSPGTRLILRTSPGPEENAVWDWAYLASAAFDHSPLYFHGQFPGFNRVPGTAIHDVAYLETEGGLAVLALHAPASLTFRLQGGEKTVGFDFGFRAGAYRNGGNTDGARYRVTLRRPGEPDAIVFERLLQPVAQPADQSTQHAAVSLPGTIEAGAELVFSIDAGPHGSPAWDWTYVANLRIK